MMHLYLSDERFQVGGQSYPGFPLLVDNNGSILEVVLLYLLDALLGKSGARDLKTWEAYGRHLYDYFGYLEAKNLQWNYIPGEGSGDIPPIAHYVRWCDNVVKNHPRYINQKVGTVQRFYRWALRVSLIDKIPFTDIECSSPSFTGMLIYKAGGRSSQTKTDLHVREAEGPLVVLTRNQIDLAMQAAKNPTHRAVLHLGLSTGLRAEELASFPHNYISDSSRLPVTVRSIAVTLNPREMNTKNDKARIIRVSVSCMNSLWQYKETVRRRLQQVSGLESKELFLTRHGLPFVSDGFVAPLARIGVRAGFHIHPHMLRHTFATHTLASLENLKKKGRLRSSPIVVLKNLLGHASITTTSRYLHFLEAIDDAYGTEYQQEIDNLVSGYIGAGTI